MISNDSPVAAPESAGRLWRFADCEFDDLALQLRVRGSRVDLELKPMEVLLQLLLRAGEVVSKDELLDAVWPRLAVVDGSLATAISKLRKALGDQESSIVLTVPRVGYRLGVQVQSRPIESQSSWNKLTFQAGDSVPGREQWRITTPLDPAGNHDVWLAEHPKTHELRVFKFAWDASRLRSLKREVTVARFLRETLGERSDFVRLLEWNFETAPFFIESEYAGVDLNHWVQLQGGIAAVPLELRLRLFVSVAQAVADAHRAGVLHKDLKPANILVAADHLPQIKVADFGSASLIEPSKLKALGITNLGMTQTLNPQSPSLTGTLMYMSPEVMAGNPPTAASDIYALGVILYQLVVGDLRKPLSPGWESGVDDPLLREDIAQSAYGDPARRLARASDLVQRITNLEKRRTEHEATERARQQKQQEERQRAAARVRRPWIAFAIVTVVVAAIVAYGFFRKNVSAAVRPASVAVLPFQNASGDSGIDYLRFALPDEISTTLSHTRPIAIRPFSSATKYSDPGVDLQKVGRELAANRIVTGRYLLIGGQLQVTMEAVDVADNRLLWRDTMNVPAKDSLALQVQLAATARGSLAPALGASAVDRSEYKPPKNQEAYELYLKTIYLTGDPEPNRQALAMLRRSVQLDPTFAPAWARLSNRAYAVARFAGGGVAMMQESDAAAGRALALDPEYSEALNELAIHHTERGELVQAYQQAETLVKRRPDDAVSHHTLNYVLRYAGLLKESAAQCEIAHKLEPEIKWGSCSCTFMELGDYDHSRSYLRDDLGSEWSKAHAVDILVREGRGAEALKIGPPKIPDWDSYNMLLACVAHKPADEIRSMAKAVKTSDDPEVNYFFAAHLAYCGQTEESLRLLKLAIQGKHCSYPAMDKDPLFASVRGTPEWADLHSQAVQCQKEFLMKRDK